MAMTFARILLRSMFEQTGATVSYDPSSDTATVSKAGAEVVVTALRRRKTA